MKCRSCGMGPLEAVVSLGEMPLANALLHSLDETEDRYPLELVRCPHCSLLQLTVSVDPSRLFGHYVYFSSYSRTMLQHGESLARRLVRELGLGTSHLVVEAASNDGYLLQYFKQMGVRVLGIEPAENVAERAREQGIPTISRFFGSELASELEKADVFVANNVLAHVPDVNGFVAGIQTVLKPTGLAVIETPYAKEMIEKGEFDTIYHEHLFYYSLTALDELMSRHDLAIDRVEPIPVHGGSIRVYVRHASSARRYMVDEPWARDASFYAGFARRVWSLRDQLRALIDGKDLAGYGAAAKATVLLNCFGIRNLRYVADRSPVKQGKFIPGVRVPIVSPERLLADCPDYTLLLAWNLVDEVMEQLEPYRKRGGRFIVPLPELRVV